MSQCLVLVVHWLPAVAACQAPAFSQLANRNDDLQDSVLYSMWSYSTKLRQSSGGLESALCQLAVQYNSNINPPLSSMLTCPLPLILEYCTAYISLTTALSFSLELNHSSVSRQENLFLDRSGTRSTTSSWGSIIEAYSLEYSLLLRRRPNLDLLSFDAKLS
jgi:hypothetical protein